MARETINGISVPIPGTGEPADFVGDLRQIATDLSASYEVQRSYGYLLSTFTSDGTPELHIYGSDDGINFTDALYRNPVYSGTAGSYVRDPSLIHRDGWFYVAHTSTDPDTGGPTNVSWFEIARSRDLIAWELVTQVDVSAVSASIGATVSQTWAPEFVEDGDDLYVFATVNAEHPIWLQATSDDLSTWTAASVLPISGGPSEVIDAVPIKHGGTYYLFLKDETVGGKKAWRATADTITGPYTVDRSGDWTGWGSVEGPFVIAKPGGGFRAYFDKMNEAGTATLGLNYSDADSLDGPWSAPLPLTVTPALPGGEKLRHGTVLRLQPAIIEPARVFRDKHTLTYDYRRAATSYSIPSGGAWAAVNTVEFDIGLPARVGDRVRVDAAGKWGIENTYGALDVQSITLAGTPLRSWALDGVVTNDGSLPNSVREGTGEDQIFHAIVARTLTADDLITYRGTTWVLLRLFARSGTGKTLGRGADAHNPDIYWSAENLGPLTEA